MIKPVILAEHQEQSPTTGETSGSQLSNATELKRIKLHLDINISPGGSSHVSNVSTKDVMDVPPHSWRVRTISRLAKLIFWASGGVRIGVLYLKNILKDDAQIIQSSSPISSSRKTISPKRRVPHYKKLLPEFSFGGLKAFSTACVIELPSSSSSSKNQQQESDAGQNTSLNNSKSQVVEKRKRNEEGEEYYSEISDEEAKIIEAINVLSAGTSPNKEDDGRVFTPTDKQIEDLEDLSSTDVDHYSAHALLHDITEEDYESAEDPDYVPDSSLTSITDSSDDEELDKVSKPEVELELQSLREEALEQLSADISGIRDEVSVPDTVRDDVRDDVIDDVRDDQVEEASSNENPHVVLENENPENPENPDDLNEPDYTNGQVSIRELTARNPQFSRHFYGSETEASSPFSVNPSEPSVPNTPLAYPSDSSHTETP